MKYEKTKQNLINSFAGESQAIQRYTAYAKTAGKEGWANIAAIFAETATNEHYHAKEFYKELCALVGEDNMPEMLQVNGSYPVANKDTHSNLMFATGGESEEVLDYNKFADEADEEGLPAIATKFRLVAQVEARHAARYKKMANLLEANKVVIKDEEVQWKCMKCGHVHTGKKAPGKCPICNHESGYFEKYELNI